MPPLTPKIHHEPTQPPTPINEAMRERQHNLDLAMYLDGLYVRLGDLEHRTIPDVAINAILRRIPGWDYRPSGDRRHLQRFVIDSTVELDAPENDKPDRKVVRNRDGLAIIVDPIKGEDLRYLIDIERQFLPQPAQNVNGDGEATTAAVFTGKFSEQAIAFHDAKGKLRQKGELFSEQEIIAMSLMTHFATNEEMAKALYSSSATTSRVIKPARERAGAEDYIDFMLVALGLKIADDKHVKGGETDYLSDKHLALLSDFYSPDPKIRARYRRNSEQGAATRWNRLYHQLELDGLTHKRHIAVLICRKG